VGGGIGKMGKKKEKEISSGASLDPMEKPAARAFR
jgi:hypothetical protein